MKLGKSPIQTTNYLNNIQKYSVIIHFFFFFYIYMVMTPPPSGFRLALIMRFVIWFNISFTIWTIIRTLIYNIINNKRFCVFNIVISKR